MSQIDNAKLPFQYSSFFKENKTMKINTTMITLYFTNFTIPYRQVQIILKTFDTLRKSQLHHEQAHVTSETSFTVKRRDKIISIQKTPENTVYASSRYRQETGHI